jgi:hypothetical protein
MDATRAARPTAPSTHGAIALFFLAIAVPVLWIGATTEDGVIASLVASAIAIGVYGVRRIGTNWPERLIFAGLAGLVGLLLLQRLPLPPWLLGALSPRAAAIWQEHDKLAGVFAWHPITLDLPGTQFALATALGSLQVFVFGLGITDSATRVVRAMQAVACVVLVFVAISLLHALFGVDTPYFLIHSKTPGGFSESILATVMRNENHAAAACGVGLALFLGLAEHLKGLQKSFMFAGAVLCLTAAMLSLSRGGISVALFECLLWAVYQWARKDPSRLRLRAIVTLVLAVVGVSIAAYVALEAILHEVSDHDTSKLTVIAKQSYSIWTDFPLVGAGFGSVPSIAVGYVDDGGGSGRLSATEHWPSDLLAQGGIVGVLLFGLIAAGVVGIAVKNLRDPLVGGCVLALIGLVVHDLVDFSLYFLGVQALAVGTLAVMARSHRTAHTRHRNHVLQFGLIAAALGAITMLFVDRLRGIDDERTSAFDDPKKGHFVSIDWLQQAYGRHPAEPVFPMIIGAKKGFTRDAYPWLVQAVKLAPNHAAPHYFLGRWFLANRIALQAYVEYRAAVSHSAGFFDQAIGEMIASHAPLEEFSALCQDEGQAEKAFEALAGAHRDADAAALDAETRERFPKAIRPQLREITHLAKSDMPGALAKISALIDTHPHDVSVYQLGASLQPNTHGEREKMLEIGLKELPARPELLEPLIVARGTRLGEAKVEDLFIELAEYHARNNQSLSHVTVLRAQIAENRGEWSRAFRYYSEAATTDDDEQLWVAAAHAAERSPMPHLAIPIWRHLANQNPDNPAYQAAIDRAQRTQP